MKTLYRKFLVQIVAVLVTLAFSLPTYAAESPREELVHAFHLLKKADHDYAGHREKAMGEVEIAGKALGLELGGDIPDAERQWKSDKQLEQARKLLRECRNKLERQDRDRVAEHVDLAVKEINLALKVK